MRDRFPGLADGWARFDGPAGTQMVDTAIQAMRDYLAQGMNSNSGGKLRGQSGHGDDGASRARDGRAAARG